MQIAIRVDASLLIGTGHLRRCLSLGDVLTELGIEVIFVVRRHDEVAQQILDKTAFPVCWLDTPDTSFATSAGDPAHVLWAGKSWEIDCLETVSALQSYSPSWVIVDHYALDSKWHDNVRDACGCRILAIDDLADRPLAVDILVDANIHGDHREKYRGRLKKDARQLGGARFALLSRAYTNAARYNFSTIVQSIGIFMGGGDPQGASEKVLQIVRRDAGFIGEVEIISSSASPYISALTKACDADEHTKLTLDARDLADFFARHDIQIGAGGTATYERCCVGAPSIGIVIAENQLQVIPLLHKMGILRGAAVENLVYSQDIEGIKSLDRELLNLQSHPDLRRQLSENSLAMVDGKGALRVALAMLGDTLSLRLAEFDDGEMLFQWRNAPSVRAQSLQSDPINHKVHFAWLEKTLADPGISLYVAEVLGFPVGSIRFNHDGNNKYEVSLYVDPEFHGLGLGNHMLAAGEKKIIDNNIEASFVATVRPENIASARLFKACGYLGSSPRFWKHHLS